MKKSGQTYIQKKIPFSGQWLFFSKEDANNSFSIFARMDYHCSVTEANDSFLPPFFFAKQPQVYVYI